MTGTLLAKNDRDVATTLSPTLLVCTPLPTSLFFGLIFEELPTDAEATLVFATSEFTSPRELIDVNELDAPTQLTTKELCKLDKLSFTSSFAKKMLNRSVFVSTTTGSIELSYH